jgi:phosphotransferase system enzyme I (PtsI)
MAMDVAQDQKVATSLCGQMSSSPKYTMLLLGLGLRTLSVPPKSISRIKAICRAVTLDDCCEVARRALELDTAVDVRNYLIAQLRRALPAREYGEMDMDPAAAEQIPT